MDPRRVVAFASLVLLVAIVAGLLVTAGDDEGSAASEATTAATTAPPVVTAPPTGPTADTAVALPAPTTTIDPDTPDLPNRGPHPEFLPVQEWIQTDATSFDEFHGKVLAVQFWTFGCSNCQATFPHTRELYEKYGGENFEIIGVHAPEFEYERDVDAVAAAAEENGLTWPIAIDNDKLNFRSWQDRRFWPRIFLIDADGNVRYDHIGEGAYDEIDAAVGALIAESTS